jgi:tetratricopeptide (TPR) repeat protein
LLFAATERATALDPNAAMTLHARANVARAQVRYADAERIYLEAIKADASYTDVREDYAELLGSSGYPEEAEKATRELLALDPRVTNFWWRLEALGLHTGRAELVDEASAKIREIDPGGRRAHIGRVLLALELGQVEAARTELAAAQRTAAAAVAKDALLFHWAVKDPDADDAEARRLIGEQTQFAIYAVVRSDRDLFLASFESDTARIGRYGFFPEVSYPVAQPWLRDPRVKQALVRYGFVGYWREKGWPALCRPLGSDDFECGPPAAKN